MVFVLLAAVALFLLTTESGARLAWRSAAQSVPGKLSGQVVGGTLDGGLVLRNVVYADKGLRIAADRIETRWELLRSPAALHIFYVRAGRVDLTLAAADQAPPAVPARLTLPMALRVDQVALDALVLHRNGATEQIADVLLHGSSNGVLHRVTLERATTAIGKASASLTLNGLPPFAMSGTAILSAAHAGQTYRVDAELAGTLPAPAIRLRVDGARLDADAQVNLAPFAAQPLRSVQADIGRVDPSRIMPEWPRADLSGQISLAASGDGGPGTTVAGSVHLHNGQAGALDQGRLPLIELRATLALGPQRSVITMSEARLAGGALVTGSATLDQHGHGPLRLQVQDLALQHIHTALIPTRLAGTVQAQLREKEQLVELSLAQDTLRLGAELWITDAQFRLRNAQLSAGRSRIALAGTLARGDAQAFSANATLASFDPAAVAAALMPRRLRTGQLQVPSARINADLRVTGNLAPQAAAQLRFHIADSSYNELPLRGGGTLALAPSGRIGGDARIEIAGNVATVTGQVGRPDDTLRFAIDAPALGRLGYGLAGAMEARGTITGALRDPRIDARLTGSALVFGQYRAQRIAATARGLTLSPGNSRQAMSLELDARGLRSAQAAIGSAWARIAGSYGAHTISARVQGSLRGEPVQLTLEANGGLDMVGQEPRWRGSVTAFENATAPRVALLRPFALTLARGRIALTDLRLRVAQVRVNVAQFQYAQGRLRTAGSVSALDLGHILALREQFTGMRAPVSSDLRFDGQWALTWSAADSEGMLRVQRVGGDVRTGAGVALGIRDLMLAARLQQNRLALDATLDTGRYGTVAGQGQVLLQRAPGRFTPLPGSPVTGTLRAAVPQLQSLAALAGPRIRVTGNAQAALTLGGTLADIRLGGSVTGQDLGLTLFDYGLRLEDGSVRLALANDIVQIERAVFYGGQGTLRVAGSFALDGMATAGPQIIADQLQVLSGPGGTLTLSGKTSVARVNGVASITGAFVVDRARMRFPDLGAPSLGDDVVVTRNGQVERSGPSPPWAGPAAGRSPRIVLTIGLGDDFRFSGGGADLLLAGELTVRRAPAQPLRVNGTVRVVEGSYEAFGTELAIERGIINFQGAPDNPGVNIHAFRRGTEVEAGVVVTGTVQRPRVQLVAEPEVSEAEKLSWLVFGHGGGGAGAGPASAAAQAAGVGLLNRFLGNRAASGLGLDQFGIGDSSLSAEGGQVINVGKEISDRLYLAYEQSITGGGSVLMLTYELSQFWSAVLYGGTVSGLEFSYSRRFDHLGTQPGARSPN